MKTVEQWLSGKNIYLDEFGALTIRERFELSEIESLIVALRHLQRKNSAGENAGPYRSNPVAKR